MHAELTRVLLCVCMFQDMESAFDCHIREFEHILSLSKAYISRLPLIGGSPTLPSFSTDCGIIFPLTFTALKCRHIGVRRDALAILESWKRREGFWDSALTTKCCRQIVDLEWSVENVAEEGLAQQVTNFQFDIADHQSDVTLRWEWSGIERYGQPAWNTHTIAI